MIGKNRKEIGLADFAKENTDVCAGNPGWGEIDGVYEERTWVIGKKWDSYKKEGVFFRSKCRLLVMRIEGFDE